MSELVNKSRGDFRASRGISQDQYVFFVDAGTNAKEVKFSMNSYKGAFQHFFGLSDIKSIDHSHFHLLIYVPPGVFLAIYSKLDNKLKVKWEIYPQTSLPLLLKKTINMLLFLLQILVYSIMDK